MRLLIDTSGVSFMVTKEPEPKVDQTGQQQHRKSDGAPMWQTQVTAMDEETGAEVIRIATAGPRPEVVLMEVIHPVGLLAIPWGNNGRNGVAFRAERLDKLSENSTQS